MKFSANLTFIVFTTTLAFSTFAGAADELPLHGFLQGNYSANTQASNPDGGDFKIAEERLELRLDASKEPFRFFLKGDAFYDHVDEGAKVKLREGYVDYVSGNFDMRAGRQIITWGHGDLVFVNDIFPKDYEAFFSGQPLEYMKKGVDALKLGAYPGPVSVEAVIMPSFEASNTPRAGRYILYDPMPSVTLRERKEPPATAKNTQAALRLYGDVAGYETAAYLYRGFYGSPSMRPDNLSVPSRIDLFYPGLNVYGLSMQGGVLNGVVSLEAGYYDSRDDRAGSDPFTPNSSAKFLAGYQRQMWEDFTLGLQYSIEYMADYSEYVRTLPAGFITARRARDVATMRLTQLLKYQTIKLSLFVIYSPADGDSIVNPEVNYKFADGIWASIGANIFGGKSFTPFGSLSRDGNAYLQARFEF
ncbi:hypothetical protein EPN18_06610 [bacterium]|nr:MAG: hypothetical protein EPN18_06610 [bacterium]